MKHHKRHILIWKFLRLTLAAWLRRKFNFTSDMATVKGPYLVLANHVTDWDPMLMALSFPEQMYYVSSEHLFRMGIASAIVRWLVDPISRLKGTTASSTVVSIMRRLRKGANVAIFAEGNRSYDGVTGHIVPSTGKLARSSGVTLVTYRLEGGYLTCPRWSEGSVRRGKMHGHVVGVYTSDELRAMTAEQVNELIARDLHENAYDRQRREMTVFAGKNMAKTLEVALYICPECGKLGSLKSAGDRFGCECGMQLVYNNYGFFEGEAKFDNVTDWSVWQRTQLASICEKAGIGELFSDPGVELVEVLAGHKTRLLGRGDLRLYADRLECVGMQIPLSELPELAIHSACAIDFEHGGRFFQISSKNRYCALKYKDAFQYLTAAFT